MDTGARISETLSLNDENFDFQNRQVYFPAEVTKSRKSRYVPISSDTALQVSKLLDWNSKFENGNPKAVFLSKTGNRFKYCDARSMLRGYSELTGIETFDHMCYAIVLLPNSY